MLVGDPNKPAIVVDESSKSAEKRGSHLASGESLRQEYLDDSIFVRQGAPRGAGQATRVAAKQLHNANGEGQNQSSMSIARSMSMNSDDYMYTNKNSTQLKPFAEEE